jgi:hypothetical protein
MNYAIVVSAPVWVGALMYYYLDGYKWFTGPKMTIETQLLTAETASKCCNDVWALGLLGALSMELTYEILGIWPLLIDYW